MHRRIVLTPFDCRLVDIHCHEAKPTSEWQIISRDTRQFVSTQPENACNTPNAFFSLGLHPWLIKDQDTDAAYKTLDRYHDHPKLLAIGECGLDKCIETPMDRQCEVFEHQIALAEQWQKPLIIHCVKAFEELIHLKKSAKATRPWIVHGFNQHPELAKQLLQHGCYLSLGRSLLNPENKSAQALKAMPLECLFLETDTANDITIGAIYAAAAKISGLTLDALRRRIFSNFTNVFFDD